MAEDVTPASTSATSKLSSDNALSRVARLRAQMERTTSENIREEGRELREAAEQSLNVILDLTLDGHVRWLSPSWTEVVGSDVEEVLDRPITDVLLDNKDIFTEAANALRSNDSNSKVIRFSVAMGPKSRLKKHRDLREVSDGEGMTTTAHDDATYDAEVVSLEAQGILIFDRSTGEESHVSLVILIICSVANPYNTDYVDDSTRSAS